MLSVSTLVVAIVLVIVVFLFYDRFIIKDFDADAFTVRSNILKEYLRRVGASNVVPEELGYVSQVDNHAYHVTHFNTSTLAVLRTDVYDDRLQTFNFQTQDFTLVPEEGEEESRLIFTEVTRDKIAPSNISFYPLDEHKFVAHADDGDVVMSCNDGVFDGTQCATAPVCSAPNTILPLTEDSLNRLVFNKLSARHKQLTHNPQHHSTLYVRCDENAEPHIEECDSGELFQDGECVFRSDYITANDYGLVIAANIAELSAKNVEVVRGRDAKVRDVTEKVGVATEDVPVYDSNNIKTYGLKTNFDLRHSAQVVEVPFDSPEAKVGVQITRAKTQTMIETTNPEVQSIKARVQTTRAKAQTMRVATDDADIIEASLKEFGNGEVGIMGKNAKSFSMNVNIGSKKTKVYKKDAVRLLGDEDLEVKLVHNEPKLQNEPKREHTMVVPVNDNLLHDYTPCLERGTGHTFVDASVSNNQYVECLANANLFVHTCRSRQFDGESYRCDVEDVCADFEDGTGEFINSMSNENITFDTGRTVCRDYQVVQVLECDTTNFVDAKKFDHPLHVALELNLPREVFHETECAPYNFDLVKIDNDNFRVRVDNTLGLDFSSMMIGRVSKVRDEDSLNRCEKVSDLVTYSRNLGELALDPKNCMGVECVGTNSVTVDVFDNTRYNLCDEHGALTEEVMLDDDEYVDFRSKKVVKREGYAGECRMDEGVDYFDEPFRMVGEISCFFTMPMFEATRAELM